MLNSKQRLLDAMKKAEAGFEVSPASLIRLVVGWMNDLELRVEEVDDEQKELADWSSEHNRYLTATDGELRGLIASLRTEAEHATVRSRFAEEQTEALAAETARHIAQVVTYNEVTTDVIGTVVSLTEQFNKRITRLEAQAAMLQAHIDLLVAASIRGKDDSPANRAAYRLALDAYRTAADYYVSLEEQE